MTMWTVGSSAQSRLRRRLPWLTTLGRGLAMRCPFCGKSPAFDGYLHVRPICPGCGTPLGRVPCDDAPPYITLLVVLHVVVTGAVLTERASTMSSTMLLAIFLPLTAVLTLLLLRPIKGATLGILLKVGIVRPALSVSETNGADA